MGSVNVQGKYVSDGFGGIEDGVSSRTQDNQSNFQVTTSLELGKFFPDKAKVSIPLYYSVSKQTTKQAASDALRPSQLLHDLQPLPLSFAGRDDGI